MSKRFFNYLMSIVFAFFLIAGCCNPAVIGSLPVQLHSQETSMWCWAASSQMIMDYLGHDVDQCVQANNRFNRNDCCNIDLCPPPTQSTAHACVTGGWPEFDKYGFAFKTTSNAALSWEDLKEQISNESYCKKRPFAFSWHWIGGGGHMMVAKGYMTLEGTNYVVILDPWAPCAGDEQIVTYDYYVQSLGHHTHWNDYYDIEYTGGE
ncbi:MAG: papain-like cysteine protease family protein [Pseudomonadota bacterium]